MPIPRLQQRAESDSLVDIDVSGRNGSLPSQPTTDFIPFLRAEILAVSPPLHYPELALVL